MNKLEGDGQAYKNPMLKIRRTSIFWFRLRRSLKMVGRGIVKTAKSVTIFLRGFVRKRSWAFFRIWHTHS